MNPASTRILMFHKPASVVVTLRDELGRRTVYDVLPHWVKAEGFLPVGRLDRDSRGLLLLVDDPGLIEALAAPGRIHKAYEAWIRGHVSEDQMAAIRKGIPSPVGLLSCVEASILRTVGHRTLVRVVLDEGRNRHIRRMFGALKDPLHQTPLKTLELKRVQFGSITLDIPSGHWRFLTPEEVSRLLNWPS